MTPYIKIKLDIESELELIENILAGCAQDNRDMNGNMFLPFLRFPVYNASYEVTPDDRLNIVRNVPELKMYNTEYLVKYLSFEPYLPYKTVEPILDYCLSQVYLQYSGHIEFKVNKIMNKGRNFLYNAGLGIEHFLEEYDIYCANNVLDKVLDIAYEIISKIREYTDVNKFNVVDLDYTTNVVYIVDKGNIKSYRYDEYMEWVEANQV